MTANPGAKDPSAKTGPGTAPPVGGRGDEVFRQSMADLSRRLGEQRSAVDPRAASETRRAALEAYDRARARRLRLALGTVGAATAIVCVAYLVLPLDLLPVPPSPATTASTEPASPVVMATAQPAVAQAAPATVSAPAPSGEPTPKADALGRDEVSEVQARLRSFGFNPGPLDGAPGPRTENAVRRYRLSRGQSQTGEVDRQLLEQLRQDPARQVVTQRATPPGARSSDLFEPLRVAGLRFNQWLESLTR